MASNGYHDDHSNHGFEIYIENVLPFTNVTTGFPGSGVP